MSSLDVRISADPDDAFAWWGVIDGRVTIPGMACRVGAAGVHANNLACAAGEPDVAAISAAWYPAIARDYALLSPGASVGRGYGPALIAPAGASLESVARGPIAVAGLDTTGGVLLRLLLPQALPVELPWGEIPGAVARGQLPAGVAIHETLMTWRALGLRRLACLGAIWTSLTALPIPVGLVVAHRRLGAPLLTSIAGALRRSVLLAFEHRAEALAFAATFSISGDRLLMEEFVDRFTNADTAELAADALLGLRVLHVRMRECGLAATAPELHPVGWLPVNLPGEVA